jgi:hypothetical protein
MAKGVYYGQETLPHRYSRGGLPLNIRAQHPAISIADEVLNDFGIQKSDELRMLGFSHRIFEYGQKKQESESKAR